MRCISKISAVLVLLLLATLLMGEARAESINISNLGIPGIEETNPEFTSSRTVMLSLSYLEDGEYCRYANHDFPDSLPDEEDWTLWEDCISGRIWELSIGNGMKYVYYQVNHTTYNTYFNDSIYYNYTGSGLDVTGPSTPVLYLPDFSNDNETITISWSQATDPESVILGISIIYEGQTYLADSTVLGTFMTTDNQYILEGLDLDNEAEVYVNLSAINSAGMRSNATAGPMTIDLVDPVIDSVSGTFYNSTSSSYQAIGSSWFSAPSINFSWEASDNSPDSGIAAYSYSLSKDTSEIPDTLPEGTPGELSSETEKTYGLISTGTYYFKVRAKDNAGNWGSPYSPIVAKIDNSMPSAPVLLSEIRSGDTITYRWQSSTDTESGVSHYLVNLSSGGTEIYFNTTTDTDISYDSLGSSSYEIKIAAVNNAGLIRWSGQSDTDFDVTPPEIKVLPNSTYSRNEVYLKVWTDEQAVCTYNTSSGQILFTHTNDTYHEAKIPYVQDGDDSREVICNDTSGNSAPKTTDYSVSASSSPTTLNGDSVVYAYSGLPATISIHASDTGSIAGLYQDEITLGLDGSDTSFVMFDVGDGDYNLSFISPDIEGDIPFEVNAGTGTFSGTLNLKKIFFSGSYLGQGYVHEATKGHMIYGEEDGKAVGLATTESNPMISGEADITRVGLNNSILIFNTKSGPAVDSREDYLESRTFFKKIVPSFGYSFDDKYGIEFIIDSKEFRIRKEGMQDLDKGTYNYILINSITGEGLKEVIIAEGDDGR